MQPKKTNFSVKTVWRDYKSLPIVLQFEGQIEELKKEKMLYQKRGTLHFRFRSLIIISISEGFWPKFGVHLDALGKHSGLY